MKIKVEYKESENNGQLKMTKLYNGGGIINYGGRTLPF